MDWEKLEKEIKKLENEKDDLKLEKNDLNKKIDKLESGMNNLKPEEKEERRLVLENRLTMWNLLSEKEKHATKIQDQINEKEKQLTELMKLEQQDEELEIDKKDLVLGKELGSGQTETEIVIAGKWNTVDVAIIMKKEWPINEDSFIAEAKVMKALKHENLVRLCGVCTKQGPMYIVTEYLVNGSLLQYLRHRQDTPLPSDTHIHMAAQICSAMAYLEVNRFIHRDLAARNCFVGERNVVKVGHFGLARFVPNSEYIAPEGSKFPIRWSAPELLIYCKFSSKSDVWSYGILLWELLTGGKNPYTDFTNVQVVDQVIKGYRLDKPKDCPPEVCHIMDSTWQESPAARPTFKELLASLKQLQ